MNMINFALNVFQLLQQCSEEEVMEVVLPRLAHSVTLWEFLLMRVEKGKPSRPHCTDILREYDQLRKHVRGICKKCLKLTSSKSDGENFEIACTAGTKVQVSQLRSLYIRDNFVLTL